MSRAERSRSVVDASVVVKWAFPEPGSESARALLRQWTDGAIDLVAPDLLPIEATNAGVKKVRRAEITAGEFRVGMDLVEAVLPKTFPSHDLLGPAAALALAHRQTVYDCLYLALALDLRCDLVTADDRFRQGIGAAYPFVRGL